MDFEKFLRDDAFVKFQISITKNFSRFSYSISDSISKQSSDKYCTEDFFDDLKEDLQLPDQKKKIKLFFTKNSNHAKKFRKYCIDMLFHKRLPLPEFDNLLKTFFRHFPPDEILTAFNSQSSLMRAAERPLISKHIAYLLKQTFTQFGINQADFLSAISLNQSIVENNYDNIRNGLLTFIAKYKSSINYDLFVNHEPRQSQIMAFELELSKIIQKNIKKEDLPEFEQFWSSVLITDNNSENLFTPIVNVSVCNLNYDFLFKKFPKLNNLIYANNAVDQVCAFINQELTAYLAISRVSGLSGQFSVVVEFKKNLKEDNLLEIFTTILELYRKNDYAEEIANKRLFNDKYDETLKTLEKRLDCLSLENVLPVKNTSTNGDHSIARVKI